jgi:hypothetical protein
MTWANTGPARTMSAVTWWLRSRSFLDVSDQAYLAEDPVALAVRQPVLRGPAARCVRLTHRSRHRSPPSLSSSLARISAVAIGEQTDSRYVVFTDSRARRVPGRNARP